MISFQRKSARRPGVRALLIAPLVLFGQACTDLTEVPQDALTPANAFRTEAEVLAGVASVYAGLRGTEWGYYNLSEITTDEMIVPTRGSDWYDNGRWLEIHRQTWGTEGGSVSDDMNGMWNDLFSGVARANLMIDVITKAGGGTAPRTLAELRTLRAWYYYMLQDMFGGVPLVTSTELTQNPRATRTAVFAFIEKELTESVADLPERWEASGYGRVTKGVANAILASLYINAGVFNKDAGVNATSYNSCNVPVSGGKNGCQAAIDAANAVINSGTYQLASDWRQNFARDNQGSPENIFVIVHTSELALGGNLPMRTLHYNQLSTGWGSPWNGFATLAETYDRFDPADVRRSMWLAGQAFSFETNAAVTDRNGNPLIFTSVIADADRASEGDGVRFNKFPPMPSAPSGNGHPNDYPFFRLAEMYLIKAEALMELGQTAGALVEVNRVRARAFEPDRPLAAVSRDAILTERQLELAGEGKRRQDLIRFGRFLNRWSTVMANGKQDKTGEPYRILMPIPPQQIAANPQLNQNPGY